MKRKEKTVQHIETAKLGEVITKEKTGAFEDLKSKLSGIKMADGLSDLKNKIFGFGKEKKIEEPIIEPVSLAEEIIDILEESKDCIIEDILEEGLPETEIVKEILEIEKIEEKLEQINPEVNTSIFSGYGFEYTDIYRNKMLLRTIQKKLGVYTKVHLMMNNLNFDNWFNLTKSPFEIFHKDRKILDFYEEGKDVYILRDTMVVDAESFPLIEIRISNIRI